MKRIILCLMLLAGFCISEANSQVYLRAGYQTSLPSLDNFNALIDRYNETRSFLDDEMNNIMTMDGFVFGAGFKNEWIGNEFVWMGRKKTVSASGTPQGATASVTRDLRVRYNQWSYLIHFYLAERFSMGTSIDLGNFKVLTRLDDDKYDEIDENFMVGSTFFIDLTFGSGITGLSLLAYVHVPYFDFEFHNSGQVLDAANYDTFGYDDFVDRPVCFGIAFSLKLGSDEGCS